MADRTVTAKWGKVSLTLNLPATATLATLRDLITDATKVPGDRQKITSKGKFVKDDAAVAALATGAQLVVMGTADEVAQGPTRPVVFEEDLTQEQKAHLNVAKEVPGLKNLGNTCYMNSTLQALRAVPELRQALGNYSAMHAHSIMTPGNVAAFLGRPAPSPAAGGSAMDDDDDTGSGALTEAGAAGSGGAGGANLNAVLTHALGMLYSAQDRSAGPVVPSLFLQALRKSYPQFDERGRGGMHSQQDADECLSQLLTSLSTEMKEVPASPALNHGHTNWVDLLFSGEMTSVLTPKEDGAQGEVVRKSIEDFRKLRCTIGMETNYMIEGIKQSLSETITKRSPKLGRDALYERRSYVTKLPQYLVVQFVRFFWRRDNDEKTKIIRKVQFPAKFDIFELTGFELKEQLAARRALMLAEQDEKLGIAGLNKAGAAASAATAGTGSSSTAAAAGGAASSSSSSSSSAMGDGDSATAVGSDEAKAAAKPKAAPHPLTSGQYDLTSIVTHKGREADAGHYVGWAKGADDKWWKYDDDVVSQVPDAEEVLRLAGGGDWHTAYICIYKRIDDVTAASSGVVATAAAAAAAAAKPADAPVSK